MSRIRGDLRERTFRFATVILQLIDRLPNNPKSREIGRQLIRSGTAIGANVHETDNARTRREFAMKCSIARKEAAETHYWLRLLIASGVLAGPAVESAHQEADERARFCQRLSGVAIRGAS